MDDVSDLSYKLYSVPTVPCSFGHSATNIMRSLLFFCSFTLLILSTSAQSLRAYDGWWLPQTNQCNSNSECDFVNLPRCCVSRLTGIGKRSVVLQLSQSGTCQTFGGQGAGCLVSNGNGNQDGKGIYSASCPCLPGHTCVGSGIIEVPLGEVGTCKKEEPGTCKTTSDCGRGECCVEPDFRRGKRQVGNTCKPLGQINSMCFPGRANRDPSLGVCPCGSNLKCEADGGRIVPQGPTGTCKKKEPGPCKTNSDCGRGECCVEPDFRRGKRQVGNTCKPLGQINSKCFPGRPDRNPELGVCPCGPNLNCVADGGREIPQGFTGTCNPASIGPKAIGR